MYEQLAELQELTKVVGVLELAVCQAIKKCPKLNEIHALCMALVKHFKHNCFMLNYSIPVLKKLIIYFNIQNCLDH